MVDLLVPPPEDTGPGKLTVGKVYGGMLILENWKLSRFGQGFNTNKGLPVSSLRPPLALTNVSIVTKSSYFSLTSSLSIRPHE